MYMVILLCVFNNNVHPNCLVHFTQNLIICYPNKENLDFLKLVQIILAFTWFVFIQSDQKAFKIMRNIFIKWPFTFKGYSLMLSMWKSTVAH